jgi:hypothetical protein
VYYKTEDSSAMAGMDYDGVVVSATTITTPTASVMTSVIVSCGDPR